MTNYSLNLGGDVKIFGHTVLCISPIWALSTIGNHILKSLVYDSNFAPLISRHLIVTLFK